VNSPEISERDDGSPAIDEFDGATPIAEDEVISAARSCSAIIVIVIIVGIVTCVMFGIALLD
jgi:hypothetical protein